MIVGFVKQIGQFSFVLFRYKLFSNKVESAIGKTVFERKIYSYEQPLILVAYFFVNMIYLTHTCFLFGFRDFTLQMEVHQFIRLCIPYQYCII